MNTAEERWDKLVGDFRQLCLLRRQKKWIESDMILNSDLPRSIASWSEVADVDPAAKKSRLDAMFQAEQRRIDDAFFTVDLVTARLKEEIAPSICAQITEQVRASVLEEVRASIAEQVRATVAAEMRELRAAVPASRARREPARPAPPQNSTLSDFAEQVRSTVAQQACAAVLQELARDSRPIAPPQKSLPGAERSPRTRVMFDDIAGIIDCALAEQSRLKKYKFELSACP